MTYQLGNKSRQNLQGVHPHLVKVVERAIELSSVDFSVHEGLRTRSRQAKLVAAAGDMPILGPNCYGVINYLDGALLWPDQHGGVRVDKGVALVSQSSNIVINLGMQKRALPVAYVACLGNAAAVGLADLAGADWGDWWWRRNRAQCFGFFWSMIAALARLLSGR